MLEIQSEIRSLSCDVYAKKCLRFFKTLPGEYGYGDVFLGVKSPVVRRLAKENVELKLASVRKLIRSEFHEERLLGLIILVNKYSKANTGEIKEKLYQEYINHFKYINNWDLVDVTCPHIVGKHLIDKERSILYHWIESKSLWTRRIAMMTNWWFIRNSDLNEVFKMSKLLIDDKEDLIHKAVGWMLREAGKKDMKQLEGYLKKNHTKMPRVMLRYAIEKMPEKKRKEYLRKR